MRTLLAILAASACMSLPAQTQVHITNVSIQDGDLLTKGLDQTYILNNAEGSDHVVLYDHGEYKVKLWFKVSTHDSPRSSLKDSAVNLIMQLRLFVREQKQDERRVEKIFYLDQAKKASYKERFTVKERKSINSRSIEVSFDAELL